MPVEEWMESLARYLSYLVDDRFEEYAYDVIDGIAKARTTNELRESLVRGLRMRKKLERKAEELKLEILSPSAEDLKRFEEELERAEGDGRRIRALGLRLALLSLGRWVDVSQNLR